MCGRVEGHSCPSEAAHDHPNRDRQECLSHHRQKRTEVSDGHGPQPLDYEANEATRLTIIASRARRGRFAKVYMTLALTLTATVFVGAYAKLLVDFDTIKVLLICAVAFLALWLFTHDRRRPRP